MKEKLFEEAENTEDREKRSGWVQTKWGTMVKKRRMDNSWATEEDECGTSKEHRLALVPSSERLKLTGGPCLLQCLGCGQPASISLDTAQRPRCTGFREWLQQPCECVYRSFMAGFYGWLGPCYYG